MPRFSVSLLRALAILASPTGVAAADLLAWSNKELQSVGKEIEDKRQELAALGEPVVGNTTPQFGYQHAQIPAPPPESPWVQVDLGATQTLDLVVLIPAVVDLRSTERGAYGFPLRFRIDVSNDTAFSQFTPLLVHTSEDFSAPGVAPVIIAARGTSARYVRVTVTRLAEANGTFFFALAELMALRGDRNIALGAKVTASNSVLIPPRWSASYLVDGRTPLGPPIVKSQLPQFDALFAERSADGAAAWMAVDLGDNLLIDEVRLHPLHSWQGADVPGFRFPGQFRVELAAREDFADARPIFVSHGEDFPNPGNNPVTLRANDQRGRFVRIIATKLEQPAAPDFALSEIEVLSDGALVSLGCRVLSSGTPRRKVLRPLSLLTDGLTSYGRLVTLPVWLEQWSKRARLRMEISALETRGGALRVLAERRLIWGAGAVLLCVTLGAVAMTTRARRARRRGQEGFRTRLAQDLHDEVGSNLAAIAVISETAELSPVSAHAGTDSLREINRLARESAEAMREVLWLVGARQEGGIDLAQHLPLVARRMLPRSEIHWHALPESFPAAWPVEYRHHVFLFFKETLANVVRHARATRVEFTARIVDGVFELAIRDNGAGFDSTTARAGLGLAGLRERASTLGGAVEIASKLGEGTTVHLRVPTPKRVPSPLDPMPIVWIVEDNASFLRGMASALQLPPHRHATRGFETCEDALAALAATQAPDVILLDVGLPGMDGIEGIGHFKSNAPQASILVLTVFEDDDKIFRAICAGASGYLLKAQPVASIVAAVDQAMAGGSPMNPRVATRVLAMFAKLVPVRKDFGLTERDQAVLRCMSAGMARKQIADAVHMNPHTADYVMRGIYKKLHVNCATAAVSVAVREHLLGEPPSV